MSRIIKSHLSNVDKQEKKPIMLRALPKSVYSEEMTDTTQNLSYEELEAEYHRKGQTVIEEAMQQQAAILHEIEAAKVLWEEERNHYIEDARKIGYEEGFTEGENKGYESFANKLELANQVVLHAHRQAEQRVQRAEETILNVSVAIAEKILATVLEQEPEQYVSLIKAALMEAKENKNIQINVSPHTYELVCAKKHELVKILPEQISITIFADCTLNDWDCFIETDVGRIVANIDSQLNELKLKMKAYLEGDVN